MYTQLGSTPGPDWGAATAPPLVSIAAAAKLPFEPPPPRGNVSPIQIPGVEVVARRPFPWMLALSLGLFAFRLFGTKGRR